MKKILSLVLIALLVFSFTACGDSAVPSETETTSPVEESLQTANVYTLKGPTGMGLAAMMENKNFSFTIANAPDQIVAAISSGEADIASCPLNVAATLFKKTNGAVKLVTINTLGVMYVLSSDESVQSFADIAGKKVYATGRAATPEYILNYLLKGNDMTAETEYLGDPTEVTALAASGEAGIIMLPEPNVSTVMAKNKDLRIVADLTAEWEKISDTKLAQSGIIVRTQYLESNPKEVENFLKEYEKSVDFVNGNVSEAAAMIEKAEIVPSAAIAEKALPNCNIVFIKGEEMKQIAQGNLQILFDANKASVGGEMPSEEFYRVD